MTIDEMVDALEELPEDGQSEESGAEATERQFIFSVGESWYALDPCQVKEIASGLDIHPLPCCPPYVSGLINSHGVPCTVLDLGILLSNERLELPIRLILNRPGDSVALSCSDIVEIAEIPLSAISRFAEDDRENACLSASFSLREHRVLALSVDALMAKLESDLA